MSPNLGPAGPRGARFHAVFARSRSAGIGWSLWGFLPHFLPQKFFPASVYAQRWDGISLWMRDQGHRQPATEPATLKLALVAGTYPESHRSYRHRQQFAQGPREHLGG
jgi:hypothetical protein